MLCVVLYVLLCESCCWCFCDIEPCHWWFTLIWINSTYGGSSIINETLFFLLKSSRMWYYNQTLFLSDFHQLFSDVIWRVVTIGIVIRVKMYLKAFTFFHCNNNNNKHCWCSVMSDESCWGVDRQNNTCLELVSINTLMRLCCHLHEDGHFATKYEIVW